MAIRAGRLAACAFSDSEAYVHRPARADGPVLATSRGRSMNLQLVSTRISNRSTRRPNLHERYLGSSISSSRRAAVSHQQQLQRTAAVTPVAAATDAVPAVVISATPTAVPAVVAVTSLAANGV